MLIDPIANTFDLNEFKKIQESLKIGPPLAPNLQRKIKTYNAKVKFAELRFTGGRIQNMLVKFPKKGLPIQDERLRDLLQSRIKLINNQEFLNDNKSIKSLQSEVEALRKKFLIALTCREGKSIIIKELKTDFENEVRLLQEKVKTVNQSLPAIIIKAMTETRELVINNLNQFFSTYPSKEQLKFDEPEVRAYQINADISKIVTSIKFPSLSKLTSHFALKVNFYDLTWNDFKDKELLEEFEKKNILTTKDIEEIVEMRDALEIRK